MQEPAEAQPEIKWICRVCSTPCEKVSNLKPTECLLLRNLIPDWAQNDVKGRKA
jgi:hypothetical protein